MIFTNGKRCRSEEGNDMEISIDTDINMPDSMKRIKLDSPLADKDTQPLFKSFYSEDKESKSVDETTGGCAGPTGDPRHASCLPLHPLRRLRSQLDDSIDDIIRKSRRRFETARAPEYTNLQIVPRGPDPLLDQRVLGTVIESKSIAKARQHQAELELWAVESRHPNVYTYVQGAEFRPGPDDSRGEVAMDTNDSYHYANDVSHTGWIISVDSDVNDNDTSMDNYDGCIMMS